MKLPFSYLLLFILIASCKNYTQKEMLSKNLDFNKNIVIADSTMMEYLLVNFYLLPDTVYLQSSEFQPHKPFEDKICGYKLHFKEGHSYQHEQDCVEWGEIVTVTFKDYSLDQVRKLVNSLYPSKNYGWYENETHYRPEKYYESDWTFELEEKDGNTILRFAYSWL